MTSLWTTTYSSSLLITTISSAITTSLTSLWTTTRHSSSIITISTSTTPWSTSFHFSTSDSLAILSSSVATVYSFSSSSITTKSRTLSIIASKSEGHSSVIPSPSYVSISLTVNTNSPFESAGSTSKDISVLMSPTAHVPSKK